MTTLLVKSRLKPTRNARWMCDSRPNHHGPGTSVEGSAGILRRMHMSLADDGQIWKLLDGLAQ